MLPGGKRLWTEGTHFGDWLSLDTPLYPDPRRGGTPHDFIASAFYCYSAGLVAKAAKVLGKSGEAETYECLSGDVKAAIQEEYFTATGRLAIPTQTAYVLSLFMDLVMEEHRERVQHDFITRLIADDKHLRTGLSERPIFAAYYQITARTISLISYCSMKIIPHGSMQSIWVQQPSGNDGIP